MRLVFVFLAFINVQLFAQTPVIQKIEPLTAFPNDTIVITGNGFSDNPTELEVWFENVEGTVVSSSNFAIEVIVPPEAILSSVQVINLNSKLTGKSADKFTPSFNGEPFDNTSFDAPLIFNTSEEAWDICTCDLNTDGKPDIATSKFKRTSPFPTPTDIMVLQNTSTSGTSGNPNTLSFSKLDKTNTPALNLTFPTDNIVCGDLQGDGKPELIATRAGSPRNSIHIFGNTSTASISFATPISLFMDVGHFATRMALRDLNNDGKPEIIATNSFNDIFYVFINQSSSGNLSFNAVPLKLSIKVNASDVLTTYETDVQDFNGDGLPDILINQFQTNDLFILKNESSGSISFGSPQKISVEGAFNRVVSADFNKDGLLDIVTTSTLNDQADVLLNQSTEDAFSFSTPIELTTSLEPWGVDVGDIDGDGDADIAIANRNRPSPVATELKMNIFINNGAAIPAFSRMDITTAQPTRNVKIADMDGDGKPDLIYTSFSESPVNAHVGILRNSNCHQPRILNENALTICNGQTIRLNTIPAENATFQWKEGTNIVGSDDTFLDITAPGAYTVTATGESGACALTSQTITVTQDPDAAPADPVISGGDLPICSGEVLNLSTPASADAYVWTGPGNYQSTEQAPNGFTVSSENAGIYTLQITVNGCKSNAVTKRIDVADLTEFSISSNSTGTVCEGTPVMLSVNELDEFTFQWKKNGAEIADATASSLAPSEDGTYTVIRTPPATLNCPEIETEAFDLNFLTPPVASYEAPATACTTEPVAFVNQSITDEDATPVFTWNFGDSQSSAEANPSHTYETAATAATSLVVSYDGVSGCADDFSGSIIVSEPIQPVISASSESSCPDEEVTLSVQDEFTSFAWNTSGSAASISVLPGTYSVTTTDVNGCEAQAEITIESLEEPDLTASADPSVIPAGATAQIVATGAAEYSWSPGATLSDSLTSSPVAEPLETTAYTLTGTSADGCTSQIQLTITVEGVIGFPPAFSPNGDGQNEIWDIRAENSPDCTLNIFDGRGSRVFEGRGENWDGTVKGKPAPEGTYYYVFSCPDQKPLTGNLLLFR